MSAEAAGCRSEYTDAFFDGEGWEGLEARRDLMGGSGGRSVLRHYKERTGLA
jgi:hypothetical protein